MSFSSRRSLSTFFLCAFTVAAAFFNRIEYSIQAQEASSAATPSSQSVIDPQAQVALKKMSAAYANLRSFSADVQLVGTKGVVPQSAASIRWQRPNRFAVSFFQDGKTVRTVSNGKTIYRMTGNEYSTTAIGPSTISLKEALIASGARPLLLSSIDQLIGQLQTPATQSLTVSQGTVPGTEVVSALTRFGQADIDLTQISVVLGKTDHMMRQIKIRFQRDGKAVIGTETYSNVRANPVLPASTFVFTAPAGIKLRRNVVQSVQKERSYFDPRLKVGARPFAFSAKDLGGATVSPAKYQGRVVLLDFWATWCPPCVEEMPTVKAVYDKYHAQGFDIVGISLDRDRAALDNFLQTQNVRWPQVLNGQNGHDIAKQYGVTGIPFALLIGRDGKIVAVDLRGGALEPAVRAALARR